MVTKPGVQLIIVGYHQPKDCREFADQLRISTNHTPTHSLYIDVEASPDDRSEGLAAWGDLHYLDVSGNIGHAAACNLGARLTSDHDTIEGFDTLFFCNADTRLYSGVIDRCFDTLWSNDQYGAVGPRQIDEQGRITAAGIFGTQAAPQHRGWMERTDRYQDLRDDAVMVSGSLYMIKRHVWNEMLSCGSYVAAELGLTGEVPTGAMPAVRHYFSETTLSYHLAPHGYKNVYEGRATARHDWHKASPQGGYGEQNWGGDQAHFRHLCDRHEPPIPHD